MTYLPNVENTAILNDGTYQADIMEDVAIWTRTKLLMLQPNQPTRPVDF